MLVGASASLYDAKRTSGVRVSAAALDAWAALRRDAAPRAAAAATTSDAAAAGAGADAAPSAVAAAADGGGAAEWLLLTAGAGAADEVALKARGVGWAAAVEAMRDDEVSYLLAPATVGAATRYIFVSYCGPAVGGMRRARVAMQRSGVYGAFAGLVASVEATERAELDAASVAEKVRRAVGAGAGEVTMA